MTTRKRADRVAFAAAMFVLVLGIFFVLDRGPTFDAPTKMTTVVEESTGAGIGKRTETTEVSDPGGKGKSSKKTTTAVEEPSGNPSGKETTTTEVSPRSFTERALGDSGLILLQIGVVLLAAFLAGAFTQRVLVGDFALKVGPIEVGAVQEGNQESIVKLTAKVASLIDAQAKQKADLETVARDVSLGLVNIGSAIAQMRDRIARLEEERGAPRE